MLLPQKSAVGGRLNLKEWVKRSLLPLEAKVLLRCRGNILHILCEGETCPDEARSSSYLSLALRKTHPNMLLPEGRDAIYRIFLYGRALGQKRPEWTVRLDPNDFLSMPDTSGGESEESSRGAIPKSIKTEDIARYLSDVLSPIGVGVRVFIKDIASDAAKASGEKEAVSAKDGKRLWVLCQCNYSPDPLLLAEPVARQLRKLVLPVEFRDAAIVGQVRGEKKPEWVCGVDLTPAEQILEEWSRWGDVGALAKLLNRRLSALDIETTAVLKESTVHLFFSYKNLLGNSPRRLADLERSYHRIEPSRDCESPKDALKAIVRPILEAVAPQGIFGATLYGQIAGVKAPPIWVDWLDLPASYQASLAHSALELARAGNERALKFLLDRKLNPDIDRKLLTGGYNVTIRSHAEKLHIMVDGALEGGQKHIGDSLVEFVASLNIPGIAGVRAYGRAFLGSVNSSTKWRLAKDFQPSSPAQTAREPNNTALQLGRSNTRIAIPELIIEDADPTAAKVLSPGLKFDSLQESLTRRRIKNFSGTVPGSALLAPNFLKQLLVRQWLFVSGPYTTRHAPFFGAKPTLPLVWGLLGLLLVVGADSFVGGLIRQMTPPRTVSQYPTEVPHRNPLDGSAQGDSALAKTTQLANLEKSYSSFNSEQLDRQARLYFQYVATVGKPDVLILGSSRALRGIDPNVLQSELSGRSSSRELRIFNFGVNGATALVVDWIVRELIHPSHLPELIVWADGARAFNSGRTDRTMNSISASEGYSQVARGERLGTAVLEQGDLGEGSSPRSIGFNTIAERVRELDDWLNGQLAAAIQSYADRDRISHFLIKKFRAKANRKLPAPVRESAVGAPETGLDEFASKDLKVEERPDESAAGFRGGSSARAIESMTRNSGAPSNGFLPIYTQFVPSTYYQQYARVPGDFDADYAAFSLSGEQTVALKNLLQFLGDRQIPLVFASMPLTDYYLDPVRTAYELKFRKYMLRFASENKLIFKDFSSFAQRKYSFFSDPSHLNALGASAVTAALASDPTIPWPGSKP